MMYPTPPLLERGNLLIASPYMPDPFFRKTVILLCEHSHVGSFGLMLNKKFEFELPEELSDIQQGLNPHVQLKIGGPVQPTQLMLLHNDKNVSHTLEILPNIYLGGDLDFLQNAIENPEGPRLCLCFGYSGWGPTELEQDVNSGLWIVTKSHSDMILNQPTEELWKSTLKSLGGKFSSLASMPDNLHMN